MASKCVLSYRSFFRLYPILLGGVLLFQTTSGRAANKCAWLNDATASGLLGGDAVGDLSPGQSGHSAICTFTQQAAGGTRTLRIAVEQTADAEAQYTTMSQSCRSDAFSLKAIGNEALACSADDRKAGLGERVVGRVRDQVFTISIGTTLKSDPVLSRDALKSRIYTAAEQVAGNLF